ncbi:PAS domain-containing sensor histidine kinase [Iningainema tapete]|uniref:histidine kinase n=1 Tax=Iningainema tapete BLCC-T55 TaxID=2748662 RepID=A0A8J6XTA8_9CYAN|nr:PAS domain-containing sensor histidine kinase [Iningainema tapete]MBD2773413.1 PAS domain-containing sensor histidine kinase [Iningainema tapete BLCC-T55]
MLAENQDIVLTPAHLELVPEKACDLEICSAETLRRTQDELLWYRKIYDNTPCVYFNLDALGTILLVNQFGADCLGYAPQELIKKPIFDLFALSEQQKLADELMKLCSSPIDIVKEEFRLNCPASKIVWVKVVARIVPDENVPTIIMVCEDITAHKQAEDEKVSLNRLKEEFLSTVSHELRTPLTNMKMAIQMLLIALNQEKNLSESAAERARATRYLDILNNECDREINLINNFLDLQRLETNPKPLVLETIQVEEWLMRVMELFKARNRHCSHHQMGLFVDAELPALIIDQFSLERILLELLANACKFSPEGEKITVTAQLKSDYIQLQVLNTGVEIPQGEIPRIFEKFYRIPSNDPWKQGGTGLGLALVEKLTSALGGTIEVKSESNNTCFSIQLPVARQN